MVESALRRVIVLDATSGVNGAYATKLLADLGARVILLEDEIGNPLRRRPPGAEREYSVILAHLAGGKEALVMPMGADAGPETLETLIRMGFREPAMVAGRIRVWHHGRYGATRSARARELLTELIPTILEHTSQTIDPDAALLKFDDFL